MELTKPNFCTVVMPNEYDYIRQFNESIKASNKFHNTMNVDPKCPPPYFPVDMGKVYGLLSHIAALESRLKEAEAVINSGQALVLKMWEVYDEPQYQAAFSLLYDHQGKYSGKTWSKEQDDFTTRAAAFLAGGDTNKV